MKIISIFLSTMIFCSLHGQNEFSLNLNLSVNKADYLSSVLLYEDALYTSTRQRDFEVGNEIFLGYELTKMNINGNIIWSDSIYSDDLNEVYLAEEQNTIIDNDFIYSIYSIITPYSQKEFLFTKYSTTGDLILSKRISINGDLSLVSGIVYLDGLIYVLQKSSANEINLLKFSLELELLDSYTINDLFGADLKLSCEQENLILSYSSIANFEALFNCLIIDKEFNIVDAFKGLPITNPSSSINALSTEDQGFIFSWSKDLTYSLFDTFPYPTAVYKYDSELNQEWEYTFYHKSEKQFINTIITEEGNIFGYGISDELYTFDIDPSPINAYSGWCFLLNPQGELLWERTIFDKRYEFLNGFYSGIQSEKGFVLAGIVDQKNENSSFINNPSSWLLSLDENGCWNGNCEDIIIIENDSVSTTDIHSISSPSISIYPNPTNNYLNLSTHLQNFEIKISDLSGNVIIDKKEVSFNKTIDISYLLSGVYIVQIKSGNNLYFQKIIKH